MLTVLWQDDSTFLWYPGININVPCCHTVRLAVPCHVLYMSILVRQTVCVCAFFPTLKLCFYVFTEESSMLYLSVSMYMSVCISPSEFMCIWMVLWGTRAVMLNRASTCLFCINSSASLLAIIRPVPRPPPITLSHSSVWLVAKIWLQHLENIYGRGKCWDSCEDRTCTLKGMWRKMMYSWI